MVLLAVAKGAGGRQPVLTAREDRQRGFGSGTLWTHHARQNPTHADACAHVPTFRQDGCFSRTLPRRCVLGPADDVKRTSSGWRRVWSEDGQEDGLVWPNLTTIARDLVAKVMSAVMVMAMVVMVVERCGWKYR